VRVQNQIIIPGESHASSRGSREGDPSGSRYSPVRHRPLYAGDPIFFGRERKMGCPDKPGNGVHFVLAAQPGMTGGGGPPPYFCHSNAPAPVEPQDVDARGASPSRFPKVRMGTLLPRFLPRGAGEGDHRAQRDGGGGERRGIAAPLPAFGGTPPAPRGESLIALRVSAFPRESGRGEGVSDSVKTTTLCIVGLAQ
jgi:hypothetical protein